MRKSIFVNHILRFIYKISNKVNIKLLGRIRVSGVVKINFEDLNFKFFGLWDDGIIDALYFKEKKYSETNELKIFKALSKKSKTVFDIGANTGIFSIISKLSNPAIDLHAFEPYGINHKRLCKNFSLNNIQNKNAKLIALGSKNERISFTVPEKEQICDALSADFEFTTQFYDKWIKFKTIEVDQISLDEYCFINKIDSIDLIKIDVENYEIEVFKGALVEIFVDKEKIAFFEKSLSTLGYYCYTILQDGLINFNGKMIANPDSGNFILSKKKLSEQYYSFKNITKLIDELI